MMDMEWFPVVFFTFKIIALSVGMFFAVKWHYDQGEKHKDKAKEKRAVLRAAGKAVAIFVLALLVLGFGTFLVIRKLGLDMTLP